MDKMSPQNARVARDVAVRHVQFLLAVADQTLAQSAAKEKPFLTENDIRVIELGKQALSLHAEPLIEMLLDGGNGFNAHRALLFLSQVMDGALMVGTRCSHRVLDERKTELMRDSRERKSAAREAAIVVAFEAEHVAGGAAKVILTGVNNRLLKEGHKPTNLTKIYRLQNYFLHS
jgi:hypothetical protein